MTTIGSGILIGWLLAGSTLPTRSFLFAPWHFATEAARRRRLPAQPKAVNTDRNERRRDKVSSLFCVSENARRSFLDGLRIISKSQAELRTSLS